MTYLEKLKKDHPDYSDDVINYIFTEECPTDHYFMVSDPEYCNPYNTDVCKKCWDREAPEETSAYEICQGIIHNPDAKKATAEFPDEPLVSDTNAEPHIKDSGDRTQFESGAVRDMREGKGRFDISPLEVMADLLTDEEGYRDPVLYYLAIFLKTNDTDMLLGALRSFSFKAYNGCIPSMLLDTAIHYEEGAKKYGEANYRKGIPTWCYIDSAARHYIKWRRGDNDEPHTRAFVWNVLCCIWEVDYGEEWRATCMKKENP